MAPLSKKGHKGIQSAGRQIALLFMHASKKRNEAPGISVP